MGDRGGGQRRVIDGGLFVGASGRAGQRERAVASREAGSVKGLAAVPEGPISARGCPRLRLPRSRGSRNPPLRKALRAPEGPLPTSSSSGSETVRSLQLISRPQVLSAPVN